MNPTFTWPEEPPIVLVGPTAVGKTAAAIALAELVQGEIINADSMQVYRGLDIGTAKPGLIERGRIPFHLLDIAPPNQQISVADWKIRAEEAITDLVRRGKRPIICGGTGLYIRALLDNWHLAETPADREVRADLLAEVTRCGSVELHIRLKQVDPVTAARLHANDAVRIIRALEVYQVTGQPISEYQRRDRASYQTRSAKRFGMTLPRPTLYQQIEQRVDSMLAAGLETEVRQLLADGYSPNLSPLKSLGYKEIIQYLNGEWDRRIAIEEIKKNTRRYAKRQQTWFHADPLIQWFDVSGINSATVAKRLHEALD